MPCIEPEQNKNYNTNNLNYQSGISSQEKEPQNDNNNEEKSHNNTKKRFLSFRKKKKEEGNKPSNVNPNTNNSNYQPEISSRLTELQDCTNNEEKFHNNINDNLQNSPETNLNIANYNKNSSQQDISNNSPDINFALKGLNVNFALYPPNNDRDQKNTDSDNTTDLNNTKFTLEVSLKSLEFSLDSIEKLTELNELFKDVKTTKLS